MVDRNLQMKISLIILIVLIITLLAYWQNAERVSPKSINQKIAIKFLKQKKYKIVSHIGEGGHYKLTKRKLASSLSLNWGALEVQPDPYIGKLIEEEYFIVRNHPLDDWEYINGNWFYRILQKFGIAKFLGSTNVTVMIVEGKAIGGTSSPNVQEPIMGNTYSLDGRTLEEIHSIDYPTWQEEWVKKYKD